MDRLAARLDYTAYNCLAQRYAAEMPRDASSVHARVVDYIRLRDTEGVAAALKYFNSEWTSYCDLSMLASAEEVRGMHKTVFLDMPYTPEVASALFDKRCALMVHDEKNDDAWARTPMHYLAIWGNWRTHERIFALIALVPVETTVTYFNQEEHLSVTRYVRGDRVELYMTATRSTLDRLAPLVRLARADVVHSNVL